MTWTYSGDPTLSTKDEVRFLIGDTNYDEQLVRDEEIEYTLTVESTPLRAAIRCCRAMSSIYARQVDKQVGDLRISNSQKAKQFRDLAKELIERATLAEAAPYVGGISFSDKELVAGDTNRVKPRFVRDMFAHPGHQDINE